jgi:peptide/nickel transport system permease protein
MRFLSANLFVLQRLARGILTIILALLLSAALMRFSPGWNVQESDLDSRFSSSTMREVREERAARRGLLYFYATFLGQVISGDFGESELFNRPVRELIVERAGATLRSVAIGLVAAWCLAIAIGSLTSRDRNTLLTAGATSVSGALLSCPSALLAIVSLLLNLPPGVAIAAVVFPRVFPHAHEQLRLQRRAPYAVMARAHGIGGLRLFRWHILPGACPALAALAGASVPLAFGASIPIEVVADSPGLGQLAWRAALGRDMPLLVALTLLLTIFSVTATLVADLAAPGVQQRPA